LATNKIVFALDGVALLTLLKRESAADPFFTRIMQIQKLFPLFLSNSILCSVPGSKSDGLESRNCRLKNGGMLRPKITKILRLFLSNVTYLKGHFNLADLLSLFSSSQDIKNLNILQRLF
jgi:hypothetical protein